MLRADAIAAAYAGLLADTVTLDYEDRHRRRLAITADKGTRFLLDLADVPSLRDGDAVLLNDGRAVGVRAAPEALMEVHADSPTALARIAWHIGNRHLAAEIGEGVLIIRADHVIEAMVIGLGGHVHHLEAAFNPERGAYSGGGHAHRHHHHND